MKKVFLSIFAVVFLSSDCFSEDVSKYLQDISVTVKAKSGFASSEGSGVIFTRDIKFSGGSKKVNFVLTAAHVIDGLRSTRSIVDPTGSIKKIVEFQDAEIVKKLVENGRTVGQLSVDAKVLKYSDAKEGEDIAILMIRKVGFVDVSGKVFTDKDGVGVPIGTQLYHVGSLLGEMGSNSMTTGIMSQIGRTVSINNGPKTIFDQTTVTAFPGSSGGGVYLLDGQYIGMLVRGSGETFNLIVPMRRMVSWATQEKVMWVLNSSIEAPSFEEIEKMPTELQAKIEDTNH